MAGAWTPICGWRCAGRRLRGAFIAFIVFALFGCIVVVLWSGASLLQSGRITIGEMTRFVLYTAFVAGAMGQFADLYSQVQKAVGATHRVRELLQEAAGIRGGASRRAAAPAPRPAGAADSAVARRSGIPRRAFPLSLAARKSRCSRAFPSP